MPKEITLKTSLAVSNGFTITHANTIQFDQATAGMVLKTQVVPTSDTVISLTGVTAPSAISIINLDATNYIDIGPTVSGAIAPCARLAPGQSLAMPLTPSVVLRGLAHTGSVKIGYGITET